MHNLSACLQRTLRVASRLLRLDDAVCQQQHRVLASRYKQLHHSQHQLNNTPGQPTRRTRIYS